LTAAKTKPILILKIQFFSRLVVCTILLNLPLAVAGCLATNCNKINVINQKHTTRTKSNKTKLNPIETDFI
jgi:hypothetical protein